MDSNKALFSQLFRKKVQKAPTQPACDPPSPSPDPVLPPEHALYTLRRLWNGRTMADEPLSIALRPEQSESPLFSPEVLAQETNSFQGALALAARQQLDCLPDGASHASSCDLDALPVVHCSQDAMAAWLMLLPPFGSGKSLSAQQIDATLRDNGILYGIDHDLIRTLPTLPHPYFRVFLVARGIRPVDGVDGQIIDHFPRTTSSSVHVDALANEDYETLHLVRDISENETICEVIPPVEGRDGRTVTGVGLPARVPEKACVPQGRNTHLSDDGRFLLASCSGHVEFSGINFHVRPVLHIHGNVDRPDQKINFLGDVHVHGDVTHGASIRAIGNIQVDGVIEVATIEAGEHIIVSSGVQGQNRAVLRAHNSIYAKYLEHCTVYARESIQADCIVECSIYCNGCVRAQTGRGAIIGGTICSSQDVTATTIGSKAERSTEIILGGLPCEEMERREILEEFEATERALAEVSSQASSPSDQARLSKLRLNQCVAKMKLEKFDKELSSRLATQKECTSARVVCSTAYPGTVVTIGHKSFRVNKTEVDCTIGIAHGTVGRV